MISFDFSGNVGNGGVRGEITYTKAKNEDNYTQTVLSGDYFFSNGVYFFIEYYHNGQGQSSSDDYQWMRLAMGEIFNLAKNYLGVELGYDWTPLIRLENYTIFNVNDQSFLLNPEIRYSFRTNIDFLAGAEFFGGKEKSEYGQLANRYCIMFQWFF